MTTATNNEMAGLMNAELRRIGFGGLLIEANESRIRFCWAGEDCDTPWRSLPRNRWQTILTALRAIPAIPDYLAAADAVGAALDAGR